MNIFHKILDDGRSITSSYSLQSSAESTRSNVVLRKRVDSTANRNFEILKLHRRSLSEGDLLHEIDNDLVLSKGFLFARGMNFLSLFVYLFCKIFYLIFVCLLCVLRPICEWNNLF